MNVFNISSFVVTIIGFIITIWQLVITRKASSAAYAAAIETKKVISEKILLSDLSLYIKMIQEIKESIRNKHNNSALLRINDLLHGLVLMRHLIKKEEEKQLVENISKMIIQLKILADEIEIVNDGRVEKLNIPIIIRNLTDYEVVISEIESGRKFPNLED